jgi:diaminohydroxyphosphoribosylaminopyrimidine deaminase/5-amino-6-(5-phosphoribosylamino)uracil reductase
LFDDSIKTLVFCSETPLQQDEQQTVYITIDFSAAIAPQVMKAMYQHQIQSVIIEGGQKTLQTFIDENLWDEARYFVGNSTFINGTKAPTLVKKQLKKTTIGTDQLYTCYNHD